MIHFRPMPILSLFVGLMLSALLGLGAWQVGRAGEKRALLAGLTAAEAAAPIPAAELPLRLRAGQALEWRAVTPFGAVRSERVALQVSDAQRREYLNPVGDDATGYVLVHWAEGVVEAPESGSGAAPDAAGRFILRRVRNPGPFAIVNQPARGIYYWIDADRMLAGLNLRPAAPGYYLAAEHLVDRQTGATRPNPRADPRFETPIDPATHIGYALTWFGLALGLFGLYLAKHVSGGRLRLGRERGPNAQ